MRRTIATLLSIVVLSSCASGQDASKSTRPEASAPTLVGAWEVTSARSTGVGKNLLTFSSDGTFFRSGDTHTLLSGAHGSWKLVGPNQYNASYVAFAFDQNGKWIGINRTNLQVTLGASGNEFKGASKSSNRDLDDKVLRSGGAPLEGKRIQVQSF
jgi:hypothetical protein